MRFQLRDVPYGRLAVSSRAVDQVNVPEVGACFASQPSCCTLTGKLHLRWKSGCLLLLSPNFDSKTKMDKYMAIGTIAAQAAQGWVAEFRA